MKIIKIIVLNIILMNICYSQEVKYTKSGIPITFYGLLNVDHISYDTDGMDTNSVIYKIIEQEKKLFRDGAYIRPAR